MPLAFIEVKKPNNANGMNAERDRINERFRNRKFKSFIDITQFMLFSNNMEYNDETANLLSGAFYASPSQGNNASVKFNHFREQRPWKIVCEIKPIDDNVEIFIRNDNHCQIIKDNPEYKTNLDPNSPTNRLITSLLCKPRLEFILKYAFAFVHSSGTVQRHIMRYPQFFATKAIADTLDKGIKRVLWHTALLTKCSVLYLLSRLPGKMRVSPDKNTRFARQESGQTFADGDEQKPKPVSGAAVGV